MKRLCVLGVEELPMVGRDGAPMKLFDLPAAHIFKEAMGFVMPYNSKAGWE